MNMNLDDEKIDKAVFALLLLGLHDECWAWKGFDWEAMNRLHEKGYIPNPRGKAKSIVFTKEGMQEAERLLTEMFSENNNAAARPPGEHVYAIIRFERHNEISEHSFAVQEVVTTQAIAESEVKRLNEANANKDCTYFWQTTRLTSPKTSAEPQT